ncbi:hypothetical protein Tco_1056637 [Tanacetum coccineum]|uniref:Uncharacterized protein n=1 Tax=Tanacetum coccineum TaxID=301880 RepID=A0ABQ5H325_9ASTR
MPHDHPPMRYTSGSVEGNMKLKELTNLCTKLVARVTSLETKLKKTKEVHGKALTKLVKKVKRLEDKLKSTNKRKKAKMVISDDERIRLFSTAEDIQDTDEELAKKVQEEEQTKVLEQQEQERANLKAALNLQK